MQRREEEEKRLQELMEAEREKDPDALEEDIKAAVLKTQASKRAQNMNTTMDTMGGLQQKQTFRQPAITLGTTLQTQT